MKIVFALILTAMMAFTPVMSETTVEETIPEFYTIEGTVVQSNEEGILINTADLGDVLVIPGEETLWEGAEALEPGDYAYVDYNGMMTRSLPPHISAMIIRSYRMEGTVTQMLPEENAMLISTETHGNVYVTLPAAPEATDDAAEGAEETEIAAEEAAAVVLPAEGDVVTVYFNGAMTMSLPGQINAGLVVIQPAEAE